jgi:hypothetical protein
MTRSKLAFAVAMLFTTVLSIMPTDARVTVLRSPLGMRSAVVRTSPLGRRRVIIRRHGFVGRRTILTPGGIRTRNFVR